MDHSLLPNELCEEIISLADRPTIANCRLVSKLWNDLSSRFLFDRISIWRDEDSLERASNISNQRHLRVHVKEIMYQTGRRFWESTDIPTEEVQLQRHWPERFRQILKGLPSLSKITCSNFDEPRQLESQSVPSECSFATSGFEVDHDVLQLLALLPKAELPSLTAVTIGHQCDRPVEKYDLSLLSVLESDDMPIAAEALSGLEQIELQVEVMQADAPRVVEEAALAQLLECCAKTLLSLSLTLTWIPLEEDPDMDDEGIAEFLATVGDESSIRTMFKSIWVAIALPSLVCLKLTNWGLAEETVREDIAAGCNPSQLELREECRN